jgi:hypothetical protein
MKWALLLSLLLTACGSALRPAKVGDEDADMTRALHDLDLHRAELRKVASMQDCGRTCGLAELVCEAAGRVCAISARHPERSDFSPRCQQAQAACAEAKGTCEGCKVGGDRP